jgi:2-dehydropantoate 2-reductase
VTRVCVAGAGSIGSLLAGHLARVADVSVLTRRADHAQALEREGLRISGPPTTRRSCPTPSS